MALHGKTHAKRIEALRNLIPFGTASDSIRGRAFPAGVQGISLSMGQMSGPTRQEFATSIVSYVVWSYETPIAWVTDSGVIVNPDHRYSATTTNHQSACRVHLGMERQRVEGAV